MTRFSPSERRSLALATGLFLLATVVRLLLAPDRAEFAWRPASADRPTESTGALRAAVRDTLARETEASRPLAPGETVDLNRADVVQLQRLPGVGAARAAAILHERTTGGEFRDLQDLARVPGVGGGLIARWAGLAEVRTTGPPLARAGSRAIDLNRAQPKELEQITGIGPALARRIVDARTRRGRFTSMEELLEIPGIGPKTLENLRDQAFVR